MAADQAQQALAHTGCSYYACSQAAAARPGVYSFTDAPAVLRFNKFVRSGYRAGYTYRQCCTSVLRWHNETGGCRDRGACRPGVCRCLAALAQTPPFQHAVHPLP